MVYIYIHFSHFYWDPVCLTLSVMVVVMVFICSCCATCYNRTSSDVLAPPTNASRLSNLRYGGNVRKPVKFIVRVTFASQSFLPLNRYMDHCVCRSRCNYSKLVTVRLKRMLQNSIAYCPMISQFVVRTANTVLWCLYRPMLLDSNTTNLTAR